jgi:UDP-N-acetylglucosamine--N-acetylmuramyl-(pentapeptide) pyrophosphoryl-undecaprenol N-acetylglucosamine transferase
MKIVVTGGGSGGHITPALAVAHELKQLDKAIEIIYVSQTGDPLADIPADDPNIDYVYTVRAGKFRRYHGEGLKQLLDVVTLYKNLRDAIFVLIGLWQSYWLLGRVRPDAIFTRGSFVSVPVCLAAKLRRTPYITHDTDAIPGLANRIIAPWAALRAVALPKEVYAYPPDKTMTLGVPIARHFKVLNVKQLAVLRNQLHLGDAGRVLLVTGGGNGSRALNAAVADCMPELLERYSDLWVVHIAGRLDEAAVRQRYKQELSPAFMRRVLVKGFAPNMYQYSGVADVVITRAGGTTIAELAAQAKACIVVPAAFLSGGHQLKNAKVLADRKAVKLVDESYLRDDHLALMPALTELFDEPARAVALGKKLATLAQPDAAHDIAVVLLEIAKGEPVKI